METPSRYEAEITRIESAVDKAVEQVSKIETYASSGIDTSLLPSPLPEVATQLSGALAALKKIVDDQSRDLAAATRLKEEADALKTQIQKQKEDLDSKEIDLNAAESRVNNIASEAKAGRTKLMADIKAHDERVKAHDKQVLAHGERLKAHDERVKAHDERVKAHEERVRSHDQTHDDRIKAHDERVKAHDERVKAHDELVKDHDQTHDKRIKAHDERVQSHDDRLQSHYDEVRTHNENVGYHQKDIEDFEKMKRKFENKKMQMEKEKRDLDAWEGRLRDRDIMQNEKERAQRIRSATVSKEAEKVAADSIQLDERVEAVKETETAVKKLLVEVESKVQDLMSTQDSASAASQTRLENLSADFVETIESFRRQVEELKLNVDDIHVMVDNTQTNATEAWNEISSLNADLEVMRPLIPQFFDAAANEKFGKEHTSPPFALPTRFKTSQTITRTGTGMVPTSSQTVVPPSDPHAVSEALPQVLSPGSKRSHPSSQKGQHKRQASIGGAASAGGASRPSSPSEDEQVVVGEQAAAGEQAGAVAQPQPQTQPEPQLQLQQQFMTAPGPGVDHIWSILAFAPAFWTEAQRTQLFEYLVKFENEAADNYKPLVQLPKCAARQAKGQALCWFSQSSKTKGNFTDPGLACTECRRLGRLCIEVTRAPADTGKSWLLRLR